MTSVHTCGMHPQCTLDTLPLDAGLQVLRLIGGQTHNKLDYTGETPPLNNQPAMWLLCEQCSWPWTLDSSSSRALLVVNKERPV